MIRLPLIDEIRFKEVADAGVPNRERIILRPTREVNLGEYVLTLAVDRDGLLQPIPDQLLWFGDETVAPPAWVFIYTGPGTRRLTTVEGSTDAAVVLHWNRNKTVFIPNGPIKPVLFRLGGMLSPRFGLADLLDISEIFAPAGSVTSKSPKLSETEKAEVTRRLLEVILDPTKKAESK